MDGLDSKEWKSVVLPKIYEEKMQKLEAELEKKVRTLMAPVQAFWNSSSYPSLKPKFCPQLKVSVTLSQAVEGWVGVQFPVGEGWYDIFP